MIITVDRADVLQEVHKQSEYIGNKQDLYEKVAATKENDELLNSFWVDGCDMVMEMVKDFLVERSGDITIELSVKNNNSGSIQSMLSGFLVNFILSSWLGVMLQKESERYSEKATGQVAVLRKLLYQRTAPKKG